MDFIIRATREKSTCHIKGAGVLHALAMRVGVEAQFGEDEIWSRHERACTPRADSRSNVQRRRVRAAEQDERKMIAEEVADERVAVEAYNEGVATEAADERPRQHQRVDLGRGDGRSKRRPRAKSCRDGADDGGSDKRPRARGYRDGAEDGGPDRGSEA